MVVGVQWRLTARVPGGGWSKRGCMAACSYTASSSSWLSLGTYAPSYLGRFSSAIGALVVGEVAALGTDSAEAALERRAGMKGAARLARHQEGETNGQNLRYGTQRATSAGSSLPRGRQKPSVATRR